MFGYLKRVDRAESAVVSPRLIGKLVGDTQAIIEFTADGIIKSANGNFLDAMGYGLAEIVGKPHRIFTDPSDLSDADYAAFWRDLREGRIQRGEVLRLRKDGTPIYLEAQYTPVHDPAGRVTGVIKIASDVTVRKQRDLIRQAKIDAIERTQAVIEFDVDGTILDANEAFLSTMGYRMEEIKGRHHRMFVEKETADSEAYRAMWRDLAAGKRISGKVTRVDRSGRTVYLQAAYTPVLGLQGEPVRVIKFADDITEEEELARTVVRDVTEEVSAISETIDGIRARMDAIQTASEDTSGNVQEVSAGTSQLAASIEEIATSTKEAERLVDISYKSADTADAMTDSLRASADGMTQVIDLITISRGKSISWLSTPRSRRRGPARRARASRSSPPR